MNPATNNMQGIYLTGHGGFDKIQYTEDIPIPKLKSNEVLIKIHAAGVNNRDALLSAGFDQKLDFGNLSIRVWNPVDGILRFDELILHVDDDEGHARGIDFPDGPSLRILPPGSFENFLFRIAFR